MSSDSYTLAVQNTIKAAPYVNMVFISFECGINLISINNDSPNLQIFASGAGKGYAPQNILKIIYWCQHHSAELLCFCGFSLGKTSFPRAFCPRRIYMEDVFFFPNRDHSFGCSISHIFKFVLSTLGKPYYFFFAWSGLEMNSTIHRVLGIPYPVTIQDVENVLKIANRILKIQAFLFLRRLLVC